MTASNDTEAFSDEDRHTGSVESARSGLPDLVTSLRDSNWDVTYWTAAEAAASLGCNGSATSPYAPYVRVTSYIRLARRSRLHRYLLATRVPRHGLHRGWLQQQ